MWELCCYMRKDGWTDRHDEGSSRYYLCELAKKNLLHVRHKFSLSDAIVQLVDEVTKNRTLRQFNLPQFYSSFAVN
jgi:hypothetical protein